MTVALPLLFLLCFTGLAYAVLRSIREGLDSYAGVYAEETARQYEDLFLFIPARRLAATARAAAVALFAVVFLLFGSFTSKLGLARGLILASLAATAALFSPGVILRILRARRARKFNVQLVDSLISMSSALKAGFSIVQAFESIVKQNEAPISQEFSLFLQELRVGVKFEEALRHMEARVGSEDLVLMNQSIEIARQTGGNLTEVFEKIAATIRERMRIEQRIRSLTAQGRLQGIVVGSVPLVLLLAMTMIHPAMMMPFFSSKAGLALLGFAGLLELGGALLIRKVMRIQV